MWKPALRCAGLLLFAGFIVSGQCAMCFRNAGAQQDRARSALNAGIAVLAVPMTACASLIGWIAHQRRRNPR
jgi:cytochrome bd-type quinol oxidase subunit 2